MSEEKKLSMSEILEPVTFRNIQEDYYRKYAQGLTNLDLRDEYMRIERMIQSPLGDLENSLLIDLALTLEDLIRTEAVMRLGSYK